MCNEVEFIEDPLFLSSINTRNFIDQQEWHLHEHVETFVRVANKESPKSKLKYPAISFTCHASRRLKKFFIFFFKTYKKKIKKNYIFRPGYFYWNVYFLIVIFMVNFSKFANFSIISK